MLDKQAMLIAELTNESLESVYDMEIDKFKESINKTQFLYETNLPEKIPTTVEIDGMVYYFDPIRPIKKAGEFIDISHLTKDKENTIYNLNKIMAVLCRPRDEGKQTFEERAEIFLHKMTMDNCYPLSVFFLNVSIKSASIIEAYLEKEVQKNMKKMAIMVEGEMGKLPSTNIGGG